jgi:hypothetical protein
MARLGHAILPIVAVLSCGGGGSVSFDGSGGGDAVDGGGEAVDGGGVASCTVISYIPSAGQTLMSCQEFSGPSAATVKENCPPPITAPPGVEIQRTGQYADGPCSRVGLVGGCRVTLGAATTTFWYYETPTSSPDVSAICAMSGLTYVSP